VDLIHQIFVNLTNSFSVESYKHLANFVAAHLRIYQFFIVTIVLLANDHPGFLAAYFMFFCMFTCLEVYFDCCDMSGRRIVFFI